MKELFSYSLTYKTKTRVTEKQEDGSEVTRLQDVEKPVKVIIKSPSRRDSEAAKNIYQESWSDAVRRGILTRAVIDKTYSNQDGVLSESQKQNLEEAFKKMVGIREKYQPYSEIKEEDRTEEEKQEIEKLGKEFETAQEEFYKIEALSDSLYRHSAENIAAEKQVLYNALFLTFLDFNGKSQSIVEGETLSARQDNLDKILDDDSNDDAKEKARLYSVVFYRNLKYLDYLGNGRIALDQLSTINEKVDKGELSL